MMNTTLVFVWDIPYFVVDNVIISIAPLPPSQSNATSIQFPPWNVTLEHNIIYSVNISFTNCVGEGDTFSFPDIKISK